MLQQSYQSLQYLAPPETHLPANQGLQRNRSIIEKQVCENRDEPALGNLNRVQLFWSFVLSLFFRSGGILSQVL